MDIWARCGRTAKKIIYYLKLTNEKEFIHTRVTRTKEICHSHNKIKTKSQHCLFIHKRRKIPSSTTIVLIHQINPPLNINVEISEIFLITFCLK